MAKLEGQTIAASYDQLLHVDTEGGGNTTTHVSVKDGNNDTTFALTLATDAVMITSTNRLEFGDDGTYIHQSADGVLDLVSDTEIEINATDVDMNGALDLDGTFTQDAGNVVFNEDSGDYDFRVESDDNTHMLFVDGGNNEVGINASTCESTFHVISTGANSAGKFEANSANAAMVEINNSRADDGNEISLQFARADTIQGAIGTTGQGLSFWTNSSLASRMLIDSSGDVTLTGDLKMAAGKGIDFSSAADTGTGETVTSSILDDYEEGYGNFILKEGSNVIDTGSDNVLVYVRVGKMVYIGGYIIVAADASVGTGAVTIAGLPFVMDNATSAGRNWGNFQVVEQGATGFSTTGNYVFGGTNYGISNMFLMQSVFDGTSVAQVVGSELAQSMQMRVSGTYMAA